MYKLILAMVLFLNTDMFEREKMEIDIIPFPQKVFFNSEYFDIPAKLNVWINSKELIPAFNKLNKAEIKSKINLVEDKEKANIFFRLNDNFNEENIPEKSIDESYVLEITENEINISSKTPKGIFYGVISLIQLIETARENRIAGMKIVDWADLQIRGVSDDIARGQVSNLENFKRIIDFLAYHKMNTYMIYIEDVIEISAYPSIGKNRGALTKSEIKEIVNYAKENYIEVIPIFQTLGHYENILTTEEFVDLAEFPGGATLSVTEEKTYTFLENCLKEIFEMFPSEYIHIGADESWDVGLGKSKQIVAESSLAKVHANHYKRVNDICKKYNKKVMMYGDIILNHPKILEELPKDITIVDWHYRPDFFYPSTVTFLKNNYEYIVSPSVWNFLTIFPANFNAVPNIIRLTNDGIQNGAKGMINSNWGDYGAETFKETVYYGYAWSAQCSWNYSSSNINKFNENFCKLFYGSDDYRLIEIYETLNSPNSITTWHELWRHPLLPFKESGWWEVKSTPYSKISWIDSRMNKTKEQINEVKKSVSKNKSNLDVLSLKVDLMLYYKLKLETQLYLHAKLKADTAATLDSLEKLQLENMLKNANLFSLIDENIFQLQNLKEKFNEQWLKYYKPDNLNMITDKFNRLISYFQETKEKLNSRLSSPEIKSKWIYNKIDEENFSPEAVFIKDVFIPDSVITAKAQILADSYAELYVNGNFINRVFARRSGSLLVDYRRIKYSDITKFLQIGNNQIKIVGKSWEKNPKAGVNFISEILTASSKIVVVSDKTWKTKQPAEDNSGLKFSTELPYKMIVTEPDFSRDRTSWIER